jgi:glutathionyl-hydroquinone reductase
VALVSASVCVEPASYKDALVSQESAEWQHAMQLEFDSLTSNQTWDLVPLPLGRRVVNNMWVYKAKTERLWGCLLVQGPIRRQGM